MPQPRKPPRVLGPYYDERRDCYYLRVVEPGKTSVVTARTEAEATDLQKELEAGLPILSVVTIDAAIKQYLHHLEHVKKDRPSTREAHEDRLHNFFPERLRASPITVLTVPRCAKLYADLLVRASPRTGRTPSVDTQQNALSSARAFLRWCCARPRFWLKGNPLAEVKPEGQRRVGKPQLRVDELRLWVDKACELAGKYEGALMAMLTIYCNLARSEITKLRVRDLDDGGTILWIEEGKTDNRERTQRVPPFLRESLMALTRGKLPTAYLFSLRTGESVRYWVKRICVEAGVPIVVPHSMRGLNATLNRKQGRSYEAVAAELGNTATVARRHYVDQAADAEAQQATVLRMVPGRRAQNDS